MGNTLKIDYPHNQTGGGRIRNKRRRRGADWVWEKDEGEVMANISSLMTTSDRRTMTRINSLFQATLCGGKWTECPLIIIIVILHKAINIEGHSRGGHSHLFLHAVDFLLASLLFFYWMLGSLALTWLIWICFPSNSAIHSVQPTTPTRREEDSRHLNMMINIYHHHLADWHNPVSSPQLGRVRYVCVTSKPQSESTTSIHVFHHQYPRVLSAPFLDARNKHTLNYLFIQDNSGIIFKYSWQKFKRVFIPERQKILHNLNSDHP